MTKATLIRTATLAALIVMTLLGRSTPVTAADPVGGRVIGSAVQIHGDKAAQFIPLGVEQEHRRRPARRHQGCAGGRSADRQRRRAHVAARLHHRRQGRTDQHLFLRRRRQAAHGLRHRGDARSQRHSRGAQACDAGLRHRDRGPRRRHHADRLGGEPGRIAAGLRSRRPARRRRQQGRQRHLGARPRPGDAQGHGRRGPARRHQAARHRPERPLSSGQAVLNFNNANPFPVNQPLVSRQRHRS